MPRPCTICIHKRRPTIDRAIVSGESNRGISRQFGVSEDSVQRHRAHIKRAIARVKEKREISTGKSAIRQFEELLAEAERKYRGSTVLTEVAWFREWRGMIELGFRLGMEAHREQQTYSDVTPAVLKMIEEVLK